MLQGFAGAMLVGIAALGARRRRRSGRPAPPESIAHSIERDSRVANRAMDNGRCLEAYNRLVQAERNYMRIIGPVWEDQVSWPPIKRPTQLRPMPRTRFRYEYQDPGGRRYLPPVKSLPGGGLYTHRVKQYFRRAFDRWSAECEDQGGE
jgi:hypothetical protein